mgnify:CR=1 FL=1
MQRLEFPSLFIEEPLLTFGEHKQHIDPKMGLLAYGPCLIPNRRVISSTIRLGVIGSSDTINLTQQWVDKCQDEIPGKPDNPLLFPSFPGFTRVFGSELRILDECVEVITKDEIKRILGIVNFNKRVRVAADLFISKLENLRVREPRPHVVILALPQEIVDSCGTKEGSYGRRRLTDKEKEILKIIRRHRKVGQTTLIPFDESVFDLSQVSRDLRRLIKARAMTLGIPTQLVKPRTFKASSKDKTIQDEATRAWNLSVGIYYKAEGYPWKLTEMSTGTCYVGVSFYRELDENVRTSIAQVFTHTGEGLVLRGGRAIQDKTTKTPHLSESTAFSLMADVIDTYQRQMRQFPSRLVVHKSSRFWPEELSGFREAAKGIDLIDFVAIETRGIRFMRRQGKYPPLRGTVIQIGEGNYILFTKGYIPYLRTYPGLRVPTPLEIVEHHGDTPMKVICKEILALTKMNWNSADFCIHEPITLAYSREVGKILAYVPEEVMIRPEYRFYM